MNTTRQLILRVFAELFMKYINSSNDMKHSIEDLCEIINNKEFTGEEKNQALSTLDEILL